MFWWCVFVHVMCVCVIIIAMWINVCVGLMSTCCVCHVMVDRDALVCDDWWHPNGCITWPHHVQCVVAMNGTVVSTIIVVICQLHDCVIDGVIGHGPVCCVIVTCHHPML